MSPRIVEIKERCPELVFAKANLRLVYSEYNDTEKHFEKVMQDKLLDRHKVCACICLAICKARLFGYPRQISDEMADTFSLRANEKLALQVALDLLYSFYADSAEMRANNSDCMLFPTLLYDRNSHFDNVVNGLLFSNLTSNLPDPWWLAQLFYHIEVHNLGLGRGTR